jgi:hypothetical protein
LTESGHPDNVFAKLRKASFVTVDGKQITKWAPMAGLWDVSTTDPIYLKPQTQIGRTGGRPVAICVSDIWFREGTAKVTVSFQKHANGGVDPDTSAAILLGFRSLDDEYFAVGLGSYGDAYVVLRFTLGSGWVRLAGAGSLENLRPEQPYDLSVRIHGRRLTLEVDGVEVLPHTLQTAAPEGRMGLYAWGESGVEFRQASVADEPANLGLTRISPAAVQVATDLRALVPRIVNDNTRHFVEEAIKCYEAELYRSAIVMSWLAAIDVLHKEVHQNHLSALNTEAKRVDTRWRDATATDDLGRMAEADFLDRIAAISVIGKNVKKELKDCLDRRNGCGHPNSLQIGANTAAHHIEILLLNVFQKF